MLVFVLEFLVPKIHTGLVGVAERLQLRDFGVINRESLDIHRRPSAGSDKHVLLFRFYCHFSNPFIRVKNYVKRFDV